MRKKGRTFSYIAEEIGIDRGVLRRELQAPGHLDRARKGGPASQAREGVLAVVRRTSNAL